MFGNYANYVFMIKKIFFSWKWAFIVLVPNFIIYFWEQLWWEQHNAIISISADMVLTCEWKKERSEGEVEEDRNSLCLYEQGKVCGIHYWWWHLCDTSPLSWYGQARKRFTQRAAHMHSFTAIFLQAFTGHFHENMYVTVTLIYTPQIWRKTTPDPC